MRDELKIEACRHITVMHRYALALSRDRARADDIVQEALARALSGLDGYRTGAPMRPWLLRIVHNVFVSETRRRDPAAGPLDEAAEVRSDQPDAEQRLAGAGILALLARLPEDQRAAVSLVCIDDLSYAEAAQVLGVPKGTLMSRLARGRAALRALVEAEERTAPTPHLRLIGGTQ